MKLEEITKKRKNLQTNIRTKAREHRDGSKDIDRFWNLVEQERALGGVFENPAPFLLKEYWEDDRTKDGKPTGDDNDVYITSSKNITNNQTNVIIKEVTVPIEEPKHKYDLHITIQHPKVDCIDKIYKFFDDMQLLPVTKQDIDDELTLVYRFDGTLNEFNILKQAVICTMDALTDFNYSVMVRGRRYDLFN